MDDVSIWLILALIAGLSLWVIYGIAKSDIVIARREFSWRNPESNIAITEIRIFKKSH